LPWASTYEYHLPQIESWLLVKIEEIAAKHSPIQVVPTKLKLTLFPLGVELIDTKIIPKKELAKTLAPATLREAFRNQFWAPSGAKFD